jgi:transposase
MNGNPRTAAFKKKIAIEALKENRTVNEIAKEYGIHPVQVTQWKKALLDGAEPLFTGRKRIKSDTEHSKADLERKVGQLTIEIDWLKKKLGM